MNRRDFLQSHRRARRIVRLSAATPAATPCLPKGKAEHCIFIWLGGGMAQIDTLDPKATGDNKANRRSRVALRLHRHRRPGVRSASTAETAPLMERVTAVRTVNHHVIDEHAAATNRVHTGRTISGNVDLSVDRLDHRAPARRGGRRTCRPTC